MNDRAGENQPRRVECPSAGESYVRLFIIAGVSIALGIWCFLDRHNYPAPPEGEPLGYYVNHYGLYVLAPLGVLFALWGLRVRKRLLIADNEGIRYVGKPKIPWPDVTDLDASQLEEKQVLRLYLASGGTMKLDGWKLKNFKDLVAFIEKRVAASPSAEAPPLDEAEDAADQPDDSEPGS